MKKNITLASILIVLLAITYVVHEQGAKHRLDQHLSQHKLFQPDKLGELKSFSNSVAQLKKEGDQFIAQSIQQVVDPRKLDRAFEILGPIQAKRFLDEQELEELNLELAFPHDHYTFRFDFENGSVEYLIGEKLQFSQDFYMRVRWQELGGKVTTRYVIATDVSPSEGMYSKETYHLSDRKYVRLLSLVFLNEEHFSMTNLLPQEPDITIYKMTVENRWNRAFTLSRDELLNPIAIENTRADKEGILSFLDRFLYVEGERLISSYQPEQLGELASTVEVTLSDGRIVELKMYEGYANETSYFVESSHRKGLFPIDQQWVSGFVSSAQRFLMRRPGVDFSAELAVRFKGAREYQLKTTEAGPIAVSDQGESKLNARTFQQFVSFFDQPADLLSQNQIAEKDRLMSWKMGGKEFHLAQTQDEILWYDVEAGVCYHYYARGNLTIKTKPEEWFAGQEAP